MRQSRLAAAKAKALLKILFFQFRIFAERFFAAMIGGQDFQDALTIIRMPRMMAARRREPGQNARADAES